MNDQVRESLERSVRLSIESGALSPSRRESSSLVLTSSGRNSSFFTPANLTMSEVGNTLFFVNEIAWLFFPYSYKITAKFG